MSNDSNNQTTEELLAQQRQQFENYQKEQASKTKKRWLWGCGGCLVVFIILSIIFTACTGAFLNEVSKEIDKQNTTSQGTVKHPSHDSNATTEQNNALSKAEIYSDTLYMSKQGIYDQLTSEYGDKFPAEAAQYAIDHLRADYKNNALKKAESYSKDMHMSKNEIQDQLTSEYGEKFTEEEAQYAIDNLK